MHSLKSHGITNTFLCHADRAAYAGESYHVDTQHMLGCFGAYK